ncbi:MAG TPA: hypothetical protein DC017_09685 [Candidatus Wallbacteria bacterium]|nr:hypothetical protein [Candidatus Wallbacteria bacterium]
MISIENSVFYEILKTQGLVGALLVYFIFQNQGVLKRLENAIKIFILCADCPYKKKLTEVEKNNENN